jgi:starch phosphorylase
MKHAMSSTLARFNAERMVLDYLRDFYMPASRLGGSLSARQGEGAKELAQWRRRIDTHWPHLQARLIRDHDDSFHHGDLLQLQVAVRLDGLEPNDLCVEAVMARDLPGQEFRDEACYRFESHDLEDGEMMFRLAIPLVDNGRFTYRIRLFPTHPRLSHPFETGYTYWL